MARFQALLLCLVISLGMSLGCTKRPSDEQVQKDIQTKAAADPVTKDAQVSVAAKDGKVTLTGTVPSADAQLKLEQIAHAEPGIGGVDDQTSVGVPPAAAADTGTSQASSTAAAPQAPPAAAPPPPPPPPIVVPAGTTLTVKLGQDLGSKTSQAGQTFSGTLSQSVTVRGQKAIPAGSAVSGTVVTAQAKGKIKGEGQLVIRLTSIRANGRNYPIQTAVIDSTVSGKGKRTAATTGGGAAGGALIGGLAGGGKGAGIGALVGAGAGFAGGAMTGNKQIEVPAGTALTFKLSAPLTLPPPDAPSN